MLYSILDVRQQLGDCERNRNFSQNVSLAQDWNQGAAAYQLGNTSSEVKQR